MYDTELSKIHLSPNDGGFYNFRQPFLKTTKLVDLSEIPDFKTNKLVFI